MSSARTPTPINATSNTIVARYARAVRRPYRSTTGKNSTALPMSTAVLTSMSRPATTRAVRWAGRSATNPSPPVSETMSIEPGP
jgi:hypothetical protein